MKRGGLSASSFKASSIYRARHCRPKKLGALGNLVGELVAELVKRHRLGLVGGTVAHGHDVVLGLFLADDEHVGHTVDLTGLANLVADRFGAVVDLHTDAHVAQAVVGGAGVVVRLLGDGKDLDLHGREPGGEAALRLLDEVRHEAVERAQDGAVEHHGGLLGAVLVDVLEVELCRQAEVELAGGQRVP